MMRTCLVFLFYVIASASVAQTVLELGLTQVQQLSYTLSKTDLTVEKGSSILLGKNLKVHGGTGTYTYAWLPSRLVDNPAAATTLATPTTSTTFYQKITDGNGCEVTVAYNVVVTSPTGTGEHPFSDELSINTSPNPASDFVTVVVRGKRSESELRVSIVDNAGKLMERKTVPQFDGKSTVDFQLKLPAGVYSMVVEVDGLKTTKNLTIKR